MPIGRSGRIVIEIDPNLKQELYAALAEDGVSLKHWFLENVEARLKDGGQLALDLKVADGDEHDRKYG